MALVESSSRPAAGVAIRSFSWALLVSILLAVLTGWLSLHVMAPNVDVSWLLVAGERIIGGAELHRDIVEVNPPFSVWLYMPLLYGELATGFRAETLLAYLLPFLALSSVLLSGSILRKAGWLANPGDVWLLPVASFGLSWLFPGDFGQREQIAAIALLPWLALFAARSRSDTFEAGNWPQIVVAGLGAAVFVMIKPPMAALSVIFPAIWFAVARRSIRPLFAPETIIAAAITLAYVVWIVVFHWAYLTDVIPLLDAYYIPLRLPFAQIISHWPLLVSAMIAFSTWLCARPARMDRAALILLLAAAGYLPGVILMGKVWTYQTIPILLFSLLAFAVQFVASGQATALRRMFAIGVVVQATLVWFESLNSQSPPAATDIVEIERVAGDSPTLVSIASRLQPAHPLSRIIRARYLSPDPALWLAHNAELLANQESGEARRTDYLARRDLEIVKAARLIKKLSPDLVVAGGDNPAPAEAAMMASPEMIDALAPYRLLYRDTGTAVFVRKDISSAR